MHYQNNDGLYAAGNVYAYNGQLVGTTNGTTDVNKLGGVRVIPQDGNKAKYISMYRMSGYGGIEARTESSTYDPIVLNEFGGAKVGVGETSPSAQLDVKVPGSGTVDALDLNKSGAYSANYQEVRLNFQNAGNTVSRMAQYLAPSTAYGFRFYTFTGGGLNTNPVLDLLPNNTVKIASVPFISSKDTVMYWDPSDSTLKRTLISGGGGAVDDVTGTANTGIVVSPTTGSVVVSADTLLLATRAWRQKGVDSLVSVLGGGAYINNQWGAQQNARFWMNGAGETDSSFRGRTTGVRSGFKTGGLIAYGSGSARTSYLQFGYDASGNYGWFQAVSEGSAYRDLIMNAAGGNLGLGNLASNPTVAFHMLKTNYPAIRFEKSGTGSWYTGNRTEGSGTDFNISYNTTDWIQVKNTGETGIGNISPREVLDVNGVVSLRTVNAGTSVDSVLIKEDGRIKSIAASSFGAATDHGTLTGLTDDDHTQYTLNAGRAGGQILHGGTGAGDQLIISGTSVSSGTTGTDPAVSFSTGNNKGVLAARIFQNGKFRTYRGHAFAIATLNTNTTLDDTHYTVLVDASGGAITITLPPCATSEGTIYVIKKIDASGNAVDIDANASETIDGATNASLPTQWSHLVIHATSTAWYIINN